MSEHTPGPWETRKARLIGGPFAAAIEVVAPDPRAPDWIIPICRLQKAGDAAEANAALLAAAPALLEACKGLLARMNGETEWLVKAGYADAWLVQRATDILAPARAAIAKAGGEHE